MAEIAGLALGALPIVIWALEKYSEPFETFHRYRTTIESFRSQIIIQTYQLEKTLSNLGLGKNASGEELEKCFQAKFPQISHELIFIVRQIDDVTMELMKSLDVSINAKQDSLLDKTQWNWSRVKHSLNTKKRNKVLESLRHWNEDLRRVVEKTELPEEADSNKIQELKLRFSPQRCSAIRKCLGSLHRALGAGLCCACPSPHQAAVDLDWESYESNETQAYKVAVSNKENTLPSRHVSSWKKLHITPYIPPELVPPRPNLLAPLSPPRTPSPISPIRSRIVRFASLSNRQTPSPSPTLPRCSSVTAAVSGFVAITSNTKATNICDAVCTRNMPNDLAGYFKDPDKDPDKDDYQLFILDPNQPDVFNITEGFQLKSLISLGDSPAGKRNPLQSLSAKQRYGIAAAIAWSVLHLGETPWLGESWSEKQANLFFEKNRHSGAPDSPRPYLSYIFSTSPIPQEHPSSEFDELIPNKVIFALGVILVELCIMDWKPGSLIEDYRTAVSRLDEVRRIAGSAYGDAAERCIKFSFPGRDMYKKFEVLEFRKQFYNDVVAPVQAAYYLMPG
ncbi:hypothetical protein F5Y19DRAFT_422953 [Xylariaceae sp. FL1651]|nr:hypothetical protein F5Y19DRAFT_422953 [Xylariaceae sp. FL1651]